MVWYRDGDKTGGLDFEDGMICSQLICFPGLSGLWVAKKL